MERVLERESELTVLEGVVRELGVRGACLFLAGEAGIGKTTLVRALGARVGEKIPVLLGACEALSVPVPLAPLRELALAAGEGDLMRIEGGDRLLLAQRLLGRLAERAPVVVVVEDAHWADAATLDVLRLLARRVEEVKVALIVTYRDDEVAGNPELARLLGDLATAREVRRLFLRPLSEVAVRALAEPAGIDAGGLSRVTGGNPFLVVEAIAAGQGLPASVRDAALARASRLGPAAREAVDAAAVIGQRVSPVLLEAVAPGAGAAVEEALARGVMVADGRVLGFRHELIREAIESAISPMRRAALHARVVAAMQSDADPADHARLAHHAELAGLLSEACRHAALAAEEAERVGALRETARQAERALRLGRSLDAAERVELLLRHSHAANFSSVRLEDALPPAREAIALAAASGDAVRQGRAEIAQSFALWSLGRVVEAKEAAERAVALLEPAGDPAALVRAQATRIRIEATAFDPGVAIALAPPVLSATARERLEETRLDVTISLGLARAHRGDAQCVPLLEGAARTARSCGFTIQTVRSHVNLVFAAATLRRHELLERAASDALMLFGEYQTLVPAKAVELYQAWSRLDRGEWARARETAARPGAGPATLAPLALLIQGLVAVRSGEAHGAELLDAAWDTMAGVPESAQHGSIRAALVESAWLRGDPAEAVRQLRMAGQEPAIMRFARGGGDLALWGHRFGVEIAAPPGAPAPVHLELVGDWRGAVRGWRELQAPYEAALAALRGGDRAARAALTSLRELGAGAAARAFARQRAEEGRTTPRGPRRATRAHPAGLTRREQEVLEQLTTGPTNAEIAAALHLSERTVAHHVSAILGKLDAPNRLAAVQHARAQGWLAKDRQASTGS